MAPLELKPARGKLTLLLLCSLAFVAAGVWFIISADSSSTSSQSFGWFLKGLGIVSILFFGACGIEALRQVLDTRPRLILDDRGIFDRTLGTPLIPWGSILDAQIVQVKRSKFIALRLTDEEQRHAALSTAKRMMSFANRGLRFGRFNLNITALSISAEELKAVNGEQLALRLPTPPAT